MERSPVNPTFSGRRAISRPRVQKKSVRGHISNVALGWAPERDQGVASEDLLPQPAIEAVMSTFWRNDPSGGQNLQTHSLGVAGSASAGATKTAGTSTTGFGCQK